MTVIMARAISTEPKRIVRRQLIDVRINFDDDDRQPRTTQSKSIETIYQVEMCI